MDWVDWDLVVVVGMVFVALSFPAILTAFSSSTPSRVGYVLLLGGIIMIVVAALQHPGGYPPDELPSVFVRVIGDLIH